MSVYCEKMGLKAVESLRASPGNQDIVGAAARGVDILQMSENKARAAGREITYNEHVAEARETVTITCPYLPIIKMIRS